MLLRDYEFNTVLDAGSRDVKYSRFFADHRRKYFAIDVESAMKDNIN